MKKLAALFLMFNLAACDDMPTEKEIENEETLSVILDMTEVLEDESPKSQPTLVATAGHSKII